jgi:hypothetical protein
VAAVAAPTAPANAYQVTFVARQYPNYTDITANLARNNIQESLQDLGANTAYQPGEPMSPSTETQNQPNCTPLDGWQFTFGNGVGGKAPGTNLSTVTNPGAPITVQPSVPLLDPQGNPTGQSIAAATTVTLTQAQVTAAMNHQLWVQGGTATDPLGAATFGTRYAFVALRCAIDNLNGDNVEWVGFPSGSTNVFCYYYAVDQKPQPGTIVIKKQLADGATSSEAFNFRGDVSYNPDNDFDVTTSNPATFVRDSNVNWTFAELIPPDPLASPDFNFTSVTCFSNGASTFNTFPGTVEDPHTTDSPSVTVDLAANDFATCTYLDTPNVTDIAVLKQTTGGVGGPFSFTVTPPPAVPPTTFDNVKTAFPDLPVEAGTVHDAAPGTYGISETLPPPTAAGSWSVSAFDCNGAAGPVRTSQTVAVPPPATADSPFDCTFTNLFKPAGSLTITKTTTGGVGTTDFVVNPLSDTTDTDVTDTIPPATRHSRCSVPPPPSPGSPSPPPRPPVIRSTRWSWGSRAWDSSTPSWKRVQRTVRPEPGHRPPSPATGPTPIPPRPTPS